VRTSNRVSTLGAQARCGGGQQQPAGALRDRLAGGQREPDRPRGFDAGRRTIHMPGFFGASVYVALSTPRRPALSPGADPFHQHNGDNRASKGKAANPKRVSVFDKTTGISFAAYGTVAPKSGGVPTPPPRATTPCLVPSEGAALAGACRRQTKRHTWAPQYF